MASTRTKPGDCRTMAEVRHGIDVIDDEIVALIGERFRYMDAAARIKTERGAVRDEARKAEVIERARLNAARAGAPPPVLEDIYERLVEASIAYEFARFDELQARVLVRQVESPDGSESTANKGSWTRSRFNPTGNESSVGGD
jgi:isochorismate pyruvate lyase